MLSGSRFLLLVLLFISQTTWSQVHLPNHRTAAQKNTQLKSYYDYWKKKYLKPSNGATPGGGYYIEMFGLNGTGSEGHKTTSEAMGYGLLITVMAHKFDPQAQKNFNGLYNMTVKHRSIHSRYLMSWVIHKTENTKYASASATDGDFDIAMALIMADKIWGSKGTVNYRLHAQSLIQEILQKTINARNHKIMLGDWWHSSWSEISRPSDWMGGHLMQFYKLTQNQRFLETRNKLYSLARHLQTVHSPKTGLLPDFISTSQNKPAPAHTLEGPYDGDYYYNSARVPLRFVIDYQQNPAPQIREVLQKMADFFHQQSAGSPQRIKGGYKLNGQVIGNYFDTTFAAPAIAAATVDSRYQNFVNTGWDLLLEQKMGYFADSLNMISLMYLAGAWIN